MVIGHTELDNVNITGFTTFATGTKFFQHTPRIEMQGSNTANISFVNATTGTTTGDGMLMGFSSSSKRINISGVGTVSIRKGTTEEMITARPDGAVELYFDGHKRLETSSVGVSIPQDLDVDGHTNLDNVNIAGVTTIGSYLKLRSFATGGSPQFTAAEFRVLSFRKMVDYYLIKTFK